jgi:hypothetical protein
MAGVDGTRGARVESSGLPRLGRRGMEVKDASRSVKVPSERIFMAGIDWL